MCRAFGATPSKYIESHSIEDFFFDEQVVEEWDTAAAVEMDHGIERDVMRLPKKTPEQVQVVISQWAARTSSR